MRIFICILLALVATGPGRAAAEVDYARAEQFLSHNMNKLILRADAEPQWLRDGRFWYRTWTAEGWEFVLVDPDRNTRTLMFDTRQLAQALSGIDDGTVFPPKEMKFADFEFHTEAHRVEFQDGKRRFSCGLTPIACVAVAVPNASAPKEHTSPDGRWVAYVEAYNVFIRQVETGEVMQLTSDGVERHGYGVAPPKGAIATLTSAPGESALAWSPDSQKIAALRWDYRNVKEMPLYSSTSPRPAYFLYPYGLPGDEHVERFDIHILGLASQSNVRVKALAQPTGFDSEWYVRNGLFGSKVWRAVKWSSDSRNLLFSHLERGNRRLSLMRADARIGSTKMLIDESSSQTVDLRMRAHTEPVWRLSSERDLLWFSWRDGWGHIYRYDVNGRLKNQVTRGAWSISEVNRVDHEHGVMYFTARGIEGGRVLNYTHGYRINLDGSGLRLLTPENADHKINYSPDGRYFVDQYSRDDLTPVTVLRASEDGRVMRELERADISGLLATGWRAPELFEVFAADGATTLYGRMYLPSDFDPSKTYPLIDNIYPMPGGVVSTWGFSAGNFGDDRMERQALAELGFVVVSIEGRGSRYRSKAFADTYQGQMGANMLPDNVAAIRQLAARHRWIDLDRVGLYGLSGGGFATVAGLLKYPELFKVGVAINGNHDNRSFEYSWGEKFQGLLAVDSVTGKDSYEDQANYTLASNLQGKLLLMVGDLDENVHPAHTLRLVHALIAANRRFDFMLFPDRRHALKEPYSVRMTWDYFVKHLLGEQPPEHILSPFGPYGL